MLESPELGMTIRYANGHVNYTATYRWDSDLVTPYGKWVPLAQVPLDQRLPLTSPKLARKSDYAKGNERVKYEHFNCDLELQFCMRELQCINRKFINYNLA